MEDWASFQSRFSTLEGVEKNLSLVKAIAASGFYKNDIELTCFACNLKVDYNDLGDNPDAVHKSLRPDCSFVSQELSERITVMLETPKNPDFTSYKLRIATFEGWPIIVVSATQLAQAGFFYRGKADKAVCYYCDATLKQWEEGDDPLTEHAKLQPDCNFLLLIKGREFIQQFERPANIETEDEVEDDDDDSVENNNEKTDDCSICLTSSKDTILVPCGHSTCCKCSFNVSTCPECRADILARIKPICEN